MLTVDHAAFLGVVLAASLIQGASGFGFGMVAMAVLPFVMDSKEAVVSVAAVTPLLCARLLWGLRRHARLRPVLPVIAGAVLVGLPLGMSVYAVADTWVFKQIIGLAVATGCALLWLFGGARTRPLPAWLRWPVGVVSGLLTGTCNVGGPPLILYMWTQPLEKAVANARLQTVFTSTTVARLGMLLAAPLVLGAARFPAVTAPVFWRALTAVPVIVVGGWVGLHVFHRTSAQVLRRLAYAFVIVMGLVLFVRTHLAGRPDGPEPGATRPTTVGRIDASTRRAHP